MANTISATASELTWRETKLLYDCLVYLRDLLEAYYVSGSLIYIYRVYLLYLLY